MKKLKMKTDECTGLYRFCLLPILIVMLWGTLPSQAREKEVEKPGKETIYLKTAQAESALEELQNETDPVAIQQAAAKAAAGFDALIIKAGDEAGIKAWRTLGLLAVAAEDPELGLQVFDTIKRLAPAYYEKKDFLKLMAKLNSLADQVRTADRDFHANLYKATAGESLFMNKIGFSYYHGRGIEKSQTQAAKWFRKAAEQGDANAQNTLGLMCQKGRGVGLDDARAVKWFRKAAEQGLVDAQYNLGLFYATGSGIGQDYAQANKWFRKAAEHGDANAQFLLGTMYQKGDGVGQDDARAVKWYRQAAEQGDARAQYNLGVLYAAGQDNARAVKWFRQAADQGHANAQYNLGVMYEIGQGVGQDEAQSVEWYRKAADQGDEEAGTRLKALGFQP